MTLNFRESLWMLAGLTAIMVTGIFIIKMPISVILLLEAIFAGIVGSVKKIPYSVIQESVTAAISSILVPIIILLLIGALVASWIMSGTVVLILTMVLTIPTFH